ncbi:PepSY domain-containing protein [Ferroacidibacillus organovorans]|uniref:PepSY domain-containing protein n=1 Tax=Ferroacidibacillus organovorans TaxID=1765683 RepID=A0A162UU84_9BACL|nr:PepSY domain-containing protein [Ferroacidibacillus organovorans]KYP82053.1 hypothetical protein AYJ22_04955 [Ferroacidibacillus organovorans]OAG94373.1 hypothetical protein AYW79_05775 [Ferroacidibacillus organovorans]OPG15231.1 hypothetical protein B2M26_12225 [Ferroacidibacillus organovorans]
MTNMMTRMNRGMIALLIAILSFVAGQQFTSSHAAYQYEAREVSTTGSSTSTAPSTPVPVITTKTSTYKPPLAERINLADTAALDAVPGAKVHSITATTLNGQPVWQVVLTKAKTQQVEVTLTRPGNHILQIKPIA